MHARRSASRACGSAASATRPIPARRRTSMPPRRMRPRTKSAMATMPDHRLPRLAANPTPGPRRGFFSAYQYVVPLALFPASYWLWLRRAGSHHGLVWIALTVPVVFGYVVPALGTNWLGLWEINTRLRLGRFRPHHGFVFGTGASLLALVCLPPVLHDGLADCVRAGFVVGSVL